MCNYCLRPEVCLTAILTWQAQPPFYFTRLSRDFNYSALAVRNLSNTENNFLTLFNLYNLIITVMLGELLNYSVKLKVPAQSGKENQLPVLAFLAELVVSSLQRQFIELWSLRRVRQKQDMDNMNNQTSYTNTLTTTLLNTGKAKIILVSLSLSYELLISCCSCYYDSVPINWTFMVILWE